MRNSSLSKKRWKSRGRAPHTLEEEQGERRGSVTTGGGEPEEPL
jgi:hypothetical protein